MLILEGVDGGGKSTLAKQLESLKFPVYHQGPFQCDPFMETIEKVLSVKDDAVFDRLHIGERVYGPVYRGVDKLGPIRQRMIERYLYSVGGYVVFVDPGFYSVRQNWEQKQDDMIKSIGQLREIHAIYRSVDCHLPWTVYNYHVHDHLDVALSYRERRPKRAPYDHVVGHWNPSGGVVLLVGERCNVDKPGPNLPFIGASGSSVWLTRYLQEHEIKEKDLAWANAVTPDGSRMHSGFIEELSPIGIIALGQKASEWLTEDGWIHETVHHPAYQMRFNHREAYGLANVIKRFLNAHNS